MTQKSESLFNRIGGMDAVNAAVDIFYNKVIQEDSIKPFFSNVNISHQSGKMKAFLAYAFGAPMKYDGKGMRQAHAHMSLTEVHFKTVATLLKETLDELNVPEKETNEVMKIAASTHNDVLNL